MENLSILKKLYPKLVNGQINQKELLWLETYFNSGDPQQLYALIRSELNIFGQVYEPTEVERKVLARVYSKIAETTFKKTGLEYQKTLKVRFWPRIAVAVSIALVLSVVGYFFFKQSSKLKQEFSYANDIAPGKLGATLTLASGKKIRLTEAGNGELAEEAGVLITKTADGKLVYELKASSGEENKVNTIVTSRGETYQLRLPDGTWVWLNAASSLSYSASLNDRGHVGQRRVSLAGEAYFEVAKDKSRPFLVETNRQQVEVLGTHFNINAYRDENSTRTTLLEGSVKVSTEDGAHLVLKPNQQSVLNTNSGLEVHQANLETVMAWKNGDFIFKDESLENIMMQITRWYDVDVVYQDLDPKSVVLGGWVSRSKNLSAVLKIIEPIAKVHFKVEGRRVTVMK